MKRLFFAILAPALALLASGLPVSAQPVTQCLSTALAGGTGDAITLPLLPCSATTTLVIVTLTATNTTTNPTMQMVGAAALPILNAAGGSVAAGELAAGSEILFTNTGQNWIKLTGVTGTTAFTGNPDALVNASGLTTTAGNVSIGGITTTNGDVGKLFFAPGLGTDGGLFSTTIGAVGQFSSAPAVSTPSKYASDLTVDVINPATGTGYVPGEVLTLTTGTAACSVLPQVTVDWTGVNGATIAAGGAGGINGTYLVRGVSAGTGNANTRFYANVTIAGGTMTTMNSIQWGGHYSTNPPSISNEPVLPLAVSQAGLTGGQLAVTMGVYRAHITRRGICTVAPTGTWTQASTTGAGSGASFSLTMSSAGTYTMGTDSSQELAAAMALTTNPTVSLSPGSYLIGCQTYTAASNVVFVGVGRTKTNLVLVPGCSLPDTGLLVWPAGTIRGGLVGLTLNLNEMNGNATVRSVLSYTGSNLILSDAGLIQAKPVGTTRMSLVQMNATGAGNTISRWIIRDSNFSLLKPTPMQTHGVNVSVGGGSLGQATGGFLSNNSVINTNLTGTYGSTSIVNNRVSGWGYGPAIATSGTSNLAVDFSWMAGNYVGGNYLHDSQPAPGEDGQSPNCVEAPGFGATVVGNYAENCAGGFSVYGQNIHSSNNTWKNNNRRADGLAHPFVWVSNLAAGNVARDGSGFTSVGDSIIDNTGRTNQIAYSEYESGGVLTGDSVKSIAVVGPLRPTGDGSRTDEDSSGGIAAATDFLLSTTLRRTINDETSLDFLSLPITLSHHGKLECADLVPAAAAQLKLRVGTDSGTFQTANYRHGGTNPVTGVGTGTGTAPSYWSASDNAINIGVEQIGVGGNDVLTVTFGDLNLNSSSSHKHFHFESSYRNDANDFNLVAGGGAWIGDGTKPITDLRLLFIDGGAVQRNIVSGRCTLTMWW